MLITDIIPIKVVIIRNQDIIHFADSWAVRCCKLHYQTAKNPLNHPHLSEISIKNPFCNVSAFLKYVNKFLHQLDKTKQS